MRKKILYCVPINIYWSQAGNLTRIKQLLQYFEDNYEVLEVDLVSSGVWDSQSKTKFAQEYPHITLLEIGLKGSKKNRIAYLFKDKLPKLWDRLTQKRYVDGTTPSFKKRMAQLIHKNKYDFLLISYASWANMIEEIKSSTAYKIVDTHDFITLQYKPYLGNNIGKAFEEEMHILSKYDEIWTYSVEEEYIFDQFTAKKVTLMPITFLPKVSSSVKDYDVLYVASNNLHNINSFNWFIENVLPLIPNVTIHVVGHICHEITDHPQLIKLGMVDDLDAIYKKSKITICPMLSGTGIKIKVLESISYGLPVVTLRRGVDGLINKINNGCIVVDNAQNFARSITKLLSDEVYCQEIAQQAREFHQSFYTPENEIDMLNKTFIK